MRLLSPVFALFVGVPILEIWLFLQVGRRIGILPTMATIVLTAAAGAWLVRQQGMAVLKRAQQSMDRGVLPANELVDGVLILAAGLLLLTPGFFTDAVGFALLLPPSRALVRVWAMRQLQGRIVMQQRSQQVRAADMEIVDSSPPDDPDE